MAWHPLNPAVLQYLRAVQRNTDVGTHALARHADRSRRTIYRWQRRFGDQLRIMPSVTVEHFGLTHAHAIIRHPDPSWLACPYAVEAAWVTTDLVDRALYLHCLVPIMHQRAIEQVFRDALERPTVVWSSSGWQQFLDPKVDIDLPSDTFRLDGDTSLLVRHPLIVPVVMESYQHPNSMPDLWERICGHRLQSEVNPWGETRS
jgi:hypothetical protein